MITDDGHFAIASVPGESAFLSYQRLALKRHSADMKCQLRIYGPRLHADLWRR